MPFHPADPSRIWSFGARRPHVGLDQFFDQIHKGHLYSNEIIRLERLRRSEANAVIRALYPDIVELDNQFFYLDEDIKTLLAKVGKSNSENRKRKADPAVQAQVKEKRDQRKVVYAALKERKKVAFADPEVKSRLALIEEQHKDRSRNAREKCGVYWGTYLRLEGNARAIRTGAPPRFKDINENQSVSIQIQANKVSWKQACEGKSQQLQIKILDPMSRAQIEQAKTGKEQSGGILRAEPPRLGGKKTNKIRRAIVSFRVGSDEKGKPVWMQFETCIHRQPPPDTQIKWVYFERRTVGSREIWTVQFVLARKDGWFRDQATEGKCAINIGWRRLKDGSIRVATMVDEDGKREFLTIDAFTAGRWIFSRQLQSTIDNNFNRCKKTLVAWLKANPETSEEIQPPNEGERAAAKRRLERTDEEVRRVHQAQNQRRRELNAGVSEEKATKVPQVVRFKYTEAQEKAILDSGNGSATQVPKDLREVLSYLHLWHSADRLAQVVERWRELRFHGDSHIFNFVDEWYIQHHHLNDWKTANVQRAIGKRKWLFGNFSADIARRYATVHINGFDIKNMIATPKKEDDDENAMARLYWAIASPGKLRTTIVEKCRQTLKVGRDAEKNATKTCHHCGHLNKIDTGKILEFTCAGCGTVHDQDVNHAWNLLKARNLEAAERGAEKERKEMEPVEA